MKHMFWRMRPAAAHTGVMLVTGFLVAQSAVAQTAQRGADVRRNPNEKLRVDYVGFRPATWETDSVYEPQQDVPNRGYAIDPAAYRFRNRKNVTVEIPLPG